MKDIKHFIDLVRKFMYDKEDKFPRSSYDLTLCIHSAKKLDNAGVAFGLPKDATHLARIKTWPDIKDDDKLWWSNGRGCYEPRICNYIFLLDQLIDTVEDVDLLVDKTIIENWLGSNKAVVDLVNQLCDQIVTPRLFYTDICDKLNKYHSKKLNVARSTFKRVYFEEIWTSSSTVVGLVFLVFSLFSTYSTIKNLYDETGWNPGPFIIYLRDCDIDAQYTMPSTP
ncbi:uncharacterized protein LOC132804448 [Ziziphus jujuba]|uniref:Uncharacterized protein LOC132804448 n=1 Tax=Ziziphus jujuba TaxID=326968 RepID=A0ABM4ADM3_ZIZJJ|nr:uncharacterized protein LOC132804448 [Ziziphus jujuba]